MFVYSDVNGFNNYLLGICRNKELELNDSQISVIDSFSYIIDNLVKLKRKGIVIDFTNDGMCEQFIRMFKKDIHTTIDHMNYFIKKYEKVLNGSVDFYYFLTSLNTVFGIDLAFDSEFIKNQENRKYIIYPNRIKVLAHLNDLCSRRYIKDSEIGEENLKKSGIYFIYGNDSKIDYIGKSASSVIRRSLESVKERGLYDFKKIEYRFTQPSNCGIYEAYYIAKYKPKCNVDMIYEDETDIYIRKLDVGLVLDEKLYTDEQFYCSYTDVKPITVDEYINNPSKYEICNMNAKGNKEYMVNYYPKPLIITSNTSRYY